MVKNDHRISDEARPNNERPVFSVKLVRKRPATFATRNRRAFTLLEIILALGLTGLLVISIGIAINIHLRIVDVGRAEVEEAQLARAVLSRIADDLRNAVFHDPLDIESLVSSSTSAGSSLGMGDALPIDLSGGSDSDSALDSGDADPTADIASSTEVPEIPGLYGNQYELQIDVSRLPRRDQYESLLTESEDSITSDMVSEVKSVAYYIVDSGVLSSDDPGGLVRRERDRAVMTYASEQGLTEDDLDLKPFAPEVTSIEFRYYDGTEMVDDWDMTEREGLPMAVEIAISVRPIRQDSTWMDVNQTTSAVGSEEETLYYFRMLVHLPIAQPTTLEGDSDMGTSEASDSSAESGGSSSLGGDLGGDSGGAPPGGSR